MRVADIEASVPAANWKSGAPADRMFDLPANMIFGKNVPRISLHLLSEIIPDHVLPSEGVIKLPVARLAAVYSVVEHREELPPEPVPEEVEIKANEPEGKLPDKTSGDEKKKEDSAGNEPPEKTGPEIFHEGKPAPEEKLEPASEEMPASEDDARAKEAPEDKKDEKPVVDAGPETEKLSGSAEKVSEPALGRHGFFTRLPIFRKIISSSPAPREPSKESEPTKPPSAGIRLPELPKKRKMHLPGFRNGTQLSAFGSLDKDGEESEKPAVEKTEAMSPAESSSEEKKETSIAEEKKPASEEVTGEKPVEQPKKEEPEKEPQKEELPAAKSEEVPPTEPAVSGEAKNVPEKSVEPLAPEPEKFESACVVEISEPEPAAEKIAEENEVGKEPSLESAPVSAPVFTMLHAEPVAADARGGEIAEQESLQALFMTDEFMTVDRVIQLCGGLPGINSCVLAYGSVVVASHNVPEGVDLVSISAHAADMLQAMRDSSARMGVGSVPAVTLHTGKGVISFFHRDDLTMLVFHRDRGFVPGVREKMAAVLGELTKARLTLPVGDESGKRE